MKTQLHWIIRGLCPWRHWRHSPSRFALLCRTAAHSRHATATSACKQTRLIAVPYRRAATPVTNPDSPCWCSRGPPGAPPSLRKLRCHTAREGACGQPWTTSWHGWMVSACSRTFLHAPPPTHAVATHPGMPCCFAAGGDAAATEAIVTTLQSFARNVCKAPHEAKYRRINLSNAGFNAKVWQYESARTFFLAWGWQVVDGFLVLPADVDSTVALATISRRLQWVPNLSTYPHPNAPIMHLSPHPFIHPAQNASELAPRFFNRQCTAPNSTHKQICMCFLIVSSSHPLLSYRSPSSLETASVLSPPLRPQETEALGRGDQHRLLRQVRQPTEGRTGRRGEALTY